MVVVEQKESKDNKDLDIDIHEWPITNTKIVLCQVGLQRRKRKYQFSGCYPDEIYPDHYYSPELLFQRANPQMFEDNANVKE